jgi:hypothetical protein
MFGSRSGLEQLVSLTVQRMGFLLSASNLGGTRAAMDRLADPESRLLDEVFWF